MRTVIGFIGGILVIGLCVAVLRNFDWNVVAAIQWLFSLTASAVNAVADFFQGNPTFQEHVVKK